MNRTSNRAAKRAARQFTAKPTPQQNVPLRLAQLLAQHIDQDGLIPVTVTVRLHPTELLALARKARHTGQSFDQAIQDMVCSGHDAAVGEWENELPVDATS